ncbi:MAG: hypothetical protein FOGNACKC_04594 [Anaerolineae bacterium]|nr:hypothetical protein [Anaerolineae bacterium]
MTIGNVSGGIHGSKIVGQDNIEIGSVTLNIVPIETVLGHALPQHSLPALRRTLEWALPYLDAVYTAATRAALAQLDQQLSELPSHEQACLQRVRAKYAKPANIFVELVADS